MARNFRQRALQQIAALSAASPSTSFDKSDLDRLCRAAPSHGNGQARENGNGTAVVFPFGAGCNPMVELLRNSPGALKSILLMA